MKSITCVVFKAELRISPLNLVVLRQVLAGLDHLDRVPSVLVHRGPRPVHLEVIIIIIIIITIINIIIITTRSP